MKKDDRLSLLVSFSTVFLLFVIVFLSTESISSAKSGSPVEYAYVPNSGSNTVSVINTTTDTVVSTLPVGKIPVGVAVSLDGKWVYVTNFGNDETPGHTVSVIDTATEEVRSMNIEGRKPSGVAVYPNMLKIYVAAFLNKQVRAVDLITNSDPGIDVGLNPYGIAITPDGKWVYVTNRGNNTVSVINTETNNVVKTIHVGESPYGVAVDRNSTKLYVTNMDSDNVSVIDIKTSKVTASIPVGRYPHGVAVTPDGGWVYVTNHNTPIGVVSVINTTINKVTANIPVGKYPCGVSITSDGTKVYVTNSGSNTTSVINTTINEVMGEPIPVGICPAGLGQFMGPAPGSRIETMTKLVLSANQSPNEKPVMLTATVNTPTSPETEKPSGQVTFIINGADPTDRELISGNANLDISSFSNSSYSIIARHKGNSKFRPSTSLPFILSTTGGPANKDYTSAIIATIGTIIAAIISLYGRRK